MNFKWIYTEPSKKLTLSFGNSKRIVAYKSEGRYSIMLEDCLDNVVYDSTIIYNSNRGVLNVHELQRICQVLTGKQYTLTL